MHGYAYLACAQDDYDWIAGQQVSKLVLMTQAFNHHVVTILENRNDIYRFSRKHLVSQAKGKSSREIAL